MLFLGSKQLDILLTPGGVEYVPTVRARSKELKGRGIYFPGLAQDFS